ncbi:MAG: RidA family protein [Rhodobacteraceae bacterium]|nr:RidA family protein [Paracoccaceae bacterium]
MPVLEGVSGSIAAWPGYPDAVRGGGFVFTSGVRGGRSEGPPLSYDDLTAEHRAQSQGFTLVDGLDGEITADAWRAHRNLDRILANAGSQSSQILRQRMWQRDKRFFPILERVRKGWQPEAAPSSGLGVSAIGGRSGGWYGIECIAVDSADSERLGNRRMLTPAEHAAYPSTSIYSQMVASGPFVFLAGHIPIRTTEPGKPVVASFDDVPQEGRFLATGRSHPDARDGPIAAQSWFVYNEIRRTLTLHAMNMRDIVHVRVYLDDLRDFATFHRVHMHFFGDRAPALSVVGFAEVGHKGCRIEIEPTALQPNTMPRTDYGWSCPAPHAGPAAVGAGPLLFLAGMLGLGPDGKLVEDSKSVPAQARSLVRSLERETSEPCVPAQIWWIWERMRRVCAHAGVPLESIAKTVVYLRHEGDLHAYESIRATFMTNHNPAFDCVLVPSPGPVPATSVQVDAVALRPNDA